jgi:3-oxoacyl-[acyl-carrier protein] reductase
MSHRPGTGPHDIAVVTGSGGPGCGRAIAVRLAAHGAQVVVTDINDAEGQETVQLIERSGGSARFCHTDVRNAAEMRALLHFTEAAFGVPTIFVNNASADFFPGGDWDSWLETLQTDLIGTLFGTRYALEAMRDSGRGVIVNVSSISALWHGRSSGGSAAYDVAKAGVIRLTTALQPLAVRAGVRINCFAPGWIATPGPLQYWESLTAEQRTARGAPSRLLTLDQVADASEFLVRNEALSGRVLFWWSDDRPRLIDWLDRGYEHATEVDLTMLE